MILITTSDYLPKLGGLSTFTRNLEAVMKELNVPYEVFHWNSPKDILNYDTQSLQKYDYVLNVHSLFCWLSNSHQEKMINFIHGSEVLMTSPNPVKHFIKTINKKKYFSRMKASHLNLFISQASQAKAVKTGFTIDYSRDVIFHNCIDTSSSRYVSRTLAGTFPVVLTCIARNVPHKNLNGAVALAELVSKQLNRQVKLIVPKGCSLLSNKIIIEELKDESDEVREEAYTTAHYNLLLSLDHSSKGFFEGFGLTVLEAGKFGVPSIVLSSGGLPEAVHDGYTGHVLSEISEDSVKDLLTMFDERAYQEMRRNCFNHTVTCHSLNEYGQLFKKVFQMRLSA